MGLRQLTSDQLLASNVVRIGRVSHTHFFVVSAYICVHLRTTVFLCGCESVACYSVKLISPQFAGSSFNSKTASSTIPVCWLLQ
jgi:hypothetical protein